MRHNLRISLIGPRGCGKTTFLKSFVPSAIDTDDYGMPNPNNSSMTHARYAVDNERTLDLIGIRVPERDYVVSLILDGMAGHIFMLDSTIPDGWPEIKQILPHVNAPSIIVANKQDHPLAHSMTAIEQELQTNLTVHPCNARDAELVSKIVLALLDRI